MDAWLREAEEASQWVEDLESRLNHKNLNISQTSTSSSVNVLGSAGSKLLELGVKLDRLESLLRNPPTKPILYTTDEDVDFRWKMLSDIQLRTRTLARSICAQPSSPNRPSIVRATGIREHNVSNDYHDRDVEKISYSQDHSDMLKPLLSEDASRNQFQIQSFSFMSMIWKACSALLLFLGVSALVFLVVLIFTAISNS
ncbi:hypothetical protein RIF29_24304 [Crotalaria pallida]|uniref:Uncharacterized protein n=1 Tax=Crotalaria pallida TaxID=3830 RepID=A0AAN9EJH4_CROPI